MVNFDEILASEWFTGDSPFGMSFHPKNPKLCVITGANATGKSLLRKLIYNEYLDRGMELMHFSQAARCRGGIHRTFLYGTEEDQSTGQNTTKSLLDTIRMSKNKEAPYSLLFDEPEIGCSDELAAGLGFRLAGALQELWEKHLECCYVISHNRHFVNELLLLNPSHVHLMAHEHDHASLRDWIDRPVTPIYNLEDVVTRGRTGWKFVQNRINENRKAK